MGLAPEFFIFLGIDIFLGVSLLSGLLDENLPSPLQYLFQGAGILGLAQMLMDRSLIDGGVFGRDPSDPMRLWISVVYLAAAIISVIGLNVYLAAVKHKLTLAATFAGTVTVPALTVSVFFVSSFVSGSGELSFTPMTAIIIAVSASVTGISVLGFLRQALRHVSSHPMDKTLTPQEPVAPISSTSNTASTEMPSPFSTTSAASIGSFLFQLPTRRRADWEEAGDSASPREEEGKST